MNTSSISFVNTDDLSEEAVVTEAIDLWQKEAQGLPLTSREARMREIRMYARAIFNDLGRMKAKGASRSDLKKSAEGWVVRLNQTAQTHCMSMSTATTEKELFDLDHEMALLHTSDARHHEHHSAGSLFLEALGGETAHQAEHLLGGSWGRGTEFVIQTLMNKAPEESENQLRDKMVSAAAHVGLNEGVGLLSGEIPGYQAVVGAHVVAKVANSVEKKLEQTLQIYSPHEIEPGSHCDEICLSPYQATQGAIHISKMLQAPSGALHRIHELVTEGSKKVLDAVGLKNGPETENSFVKSQAPFFELIP